MLIRRLENWPFEGLSGGASELDRLRRDLGRLFNGLPRVNGWDTPAGVFPLLNVSQDSENVYVRSEVPGITLDQLDVSVTGRSLTVTGERAIPDEQSNVRYHRKEREAGKFRRQLTLPTDVDNERVQAKYQHGILMVVLPKSEKAKPKKIAISG
ncbi:MAG: Hsp20/alpha crystallin family protein [Nitrospirota bacterium]|nr:Hsp20/alpha crystallin family protein [Nitrospirota bacterium]MDH5698646.1 Hsp20/alpha crystallin family protein [Nitrospirota bacterium]